ncbi:MAG: hypothetical protein KC468_22885 [Myxococcales bacterium]|nr:hypothetical protein [Myxococcales bacterium]
MAFWSTTEGRLVGVALVLVVGLGAVTVAIEYQRREAEDARPKNQVIDQRAWYDGGTLHKTTAGTFRAGEARDKVATAADLLRSLSPDFTSSAGDAALKRAAEELVRCVDAADPSSATLDAAARCRGVDLSGAPEASDDAEPSDAPAPGDELGDANDEPVDDADADAAEAAPVDAVDAVPVDAAPADAAPAAADAAPNDPPSPADDAPPDEAPPAGDAPPAPEDSPINPAGE